MPVVYTWHFTMLLVPLELGVMVFRDAGLRRTRTLACETAFTDHGEKHALSRFQLSAGCLAVERRIRTLPTV